MPQKAQLPVKPGSLDLKERTPEEQIQLALDAINQNGLNKSGRPVFSLREASRAFDVPRSTLGACYHGCKTKVQAHEHEKKLSEGAEHALVAWIKEMGRRGVPLHASAVAAHASVISGEPIGENWVHRFRARHSDLKLKWTTGLEKCRAQALNENNVTEFHDKLQELVDKYNIPEENIYNMDEKGIQLGMGKRVRAFVDRDQKCVYQVEDGD